MNEWTARLRREADDLGRRNPIPGGGGAAGIEGEWRRRIQEGSIISWLQCHGRKLLKDRSALDPALCMDPDPALVFTSDAAGLAAAKEILAGNDRIIRMDEDGYRGWLARNPDPEYRRHVHFWTFFHAGVPPDILDKATAGHPLPEGNVYWVQSEGTLWGPSKGRGVTHLLAWDGSEARLLKEALEMWIL